MTDNALSSDPNSQISPDLLPNQDVTPQAVSSIAEQIAQILQDLRADFQAKIQYDTSKDRMIDSLHRELQQYREDFALKMLEPLLNDLVQLYDDIDRVTARKTGNENADQAREDLRNHILSDLEAILQRYGYDMYQTVETTFDRKLHRVTRIIPTTDASLDLTIVERVRRGLRHGERIIRPESIVVYQYKASASEQSV